MIAIINYGMGNISSVLNMCRRLSIDAEVTSDPQRIQTADKIILPGVGHFQKGIENLYQLGLVEVLQEEVCQKKKPILGICLGAQLMTISSEEGKGNGLNWVEAHTIRFNLPDEHNRLKVPHMGWSSIKIVRNSPIWTDLPDQSRFYHVHSYHFSFENKNQITAMATYGYDFPCAFEIENIYGVQFHPEKSHRFGMQIFRNFDKL